MYLPIMFVFVVWAFFLHLQKCRDQQVKQTNIRYNSQARTIVASVLQNFERERDNQGPLLDVKKVSEREAAACSISPRTLCRIRLQLKQATANEASPNSATAKIWKKEITTISTFFGQFLT